MVDITILELHFDGASFSTDRVFSPGPADDETGATEPEVDDELEAAETGETERPDDEDGDGAIDPPTRGLAAVGVVLVTVGLGALVRYLRGGEEPDVEIETADDDENRPVGVAVDE